MWLLASMDQFVPLKITLVGECHVTNITLVSPFLPARVDQHMRFQRECSSERFATHIALEWQFTRVNSHVGC